MNIFKVELASNIALDTACQIGTLTTGFGVAQRNMQQARFEALIPELTSICIWRSSRGRIGYVRACREDESLTY